MHRAILNTRKRISIASIHGLSMDEKVVIPKEPVSKQNPANYKESSFSDFLDHICEKDTTGWNYIDSLRKIGD